MQNVNSAEVEIFCIISSSRNATSHTLKSTANVFWLNCDCVLSPWLTRIRLDCECVLTEPQLCSEWTGTVFRLNLDCVLTETRLCSGWTPAVLWLNLDCVLIEPGLCSDWTETVLWLNPCCVLTEPRLCSDWTGTVSCRANSHTHRTGLRLLCFIPSLLWHLAR